jgi:hypothetical protein
MPEYSPLLSPGFVDVPLDDLEKVFAAGFPDPSVRLDLIKSLRNFISILKGLGVTGTLWLDGSFATEKPHPGDVDCLLLSPNDVLQRLHPSDLDILTQMVHNKKDTKLRHRCDFYFCDPDDPNWRSYWRGWFGFDRNEVAKGIARLAL